MHGSDSTCNYKYKSMNKVGTYYKDAQFVLIILTDSRARGILCKDD